MWPGFVPIVPGHRPPSQAPDIIALILSRPKFVLAVTHQPQIPENKIIGFMQPFHYFIPILFVSHELMANISRVGTQSQDVGRENGNTIEDGLSAKIYISTILY